MVMSGLMSGAGKRGGASAPALAPGLDSTSRGSLQWGREFPSPYLRPNRLWHSLSPLAIRSSWRRSIPVPSRLTIMYPRASS